MKKSSKYSAFLDPRVFISFLLLLAGSLWRVFSPRNQALWLRLLLTSLVIGGTVPLTAFADTLAPAVIRQIQALEAEKESRTPAQKKMSSVLLQAFRESRGQKMAPGVPLEAANIKTDDSGLVLVDITADVSDALLANIQTLGGQIVFPSAEYNAIRARVPLTSVETIAGYPEVTFIRTAIPAKTNQLAVVQHPVAPIATTYLSLLNLSALNPLRRLSLRNAPLACAAG